MLLAQMKYKFMILINSLPFNIDMFYLNLVLLNTIGMM